MDKEIYVKIKIICHICDSQCAEENVSEITDHSVFRYIS